MANLTLSQLREAQKANPPGDINVPLVEAARQQILAITGVFAPPAGADCPPPDVSLPIQASTPVQSVPAGGGYCRIFPPEYPSLLHVPADWKSANWSGNSQWCHVEGAERHPDFEANLLAVEQSPEVVGENPGE